MLIERTVPATLEHLRGLLDEVDRVCALAGGGDAFRDELRLAVEEALVNVVKHGYAGRAPGNLRLALTLESRDGRPAVRVDLQDQGHPFDPLSLDAPDLGAGAEERPIGGLGVMLMRQLSDLQTYRHDAGHGNWLTLVKYLPADPAA